MTHGVLINHECVIVDIDGTLADCSHRAEHVIKRPKDWDTFDSLMHLDQPVELIVKLVKILRQHYPIILCSGRKESHRPQTVEWLRKHDVWHDGLFMRATNDFRDDCIVKRELLVEIKECGWRPQFVIDDRDKVVAMWRAEGLVCLQCRAGNF